MNILVFLSAMLLLGFNIYCVAKHSFPESYSAFYYNASNLNHNSNFSWWQVATMGAALLLIPPMITLAEGMWFQFLGFLAPVYLFMVGVYPDFKSSKKNHIIHTVMALISAACSVVWMSLITNYWWIILLCSLAIFTFLGVKKKLFRTSYTWLIEMAAFLSIYLTLLL